MQLSVQQRIVRLQFLLRTSAARGLHHVRASSTTFYNPPSKTTIIHHVRASSSTFYNPPPNSRLIQNILQSSTKFYNPPPNSTTLHQILPSTTKFCHPPPNSAIHHQIPNRCVSTPPSTPLFKHSTIYPLFLFLHNPLHLETFTIQHNWHFVFQSYLLWKDAACNLFLTLEHLKRLGTL